MKTAPTADVAVDDDGCTCLACQMGRRAQAWVRQALTFNDSDKEDEAIGVARRYVELAILIARSPINAGPSDEEEDTSHHVRH